MLREVRNPCEPEAPRRASWRITRDYESYKGKEYDAVPDLIQVVREILHGDVAFEQR